MKFFRYLVVFTIFILGFNSCKKEKKDRWDVKVENNTEKIQITDISKDFYDVNIPFSQFKEKYGFFLSSGFDDQFYTEKRKNPLEIEIYKKSVTPQMISRLSTELPKLFARIKHYFPGFETPKVYVFSSATAMYQEPVLYNPEMKAVIIDLSSFLGEKSEYYQGLEAYYKPSMNPENLLPKTALAFAQTMVPANLEQQKFIDLLVQSGKTMILQDAFLPKTADHLKINYQVKQYDWAKKNEAHIWNFFVENDLIFSDDARLQERFVAPGPFSKFYTAIDNESSPQIGIFTGWQICKKYFENNPDTKLQDFLNMGATEIFNQSEYKPKN